MAFYSGKTENMKVQKAIKRMKLLRMNQAVDEKTNRTPKHKHPLLPRSFQVYCSNHRDAA